jgi:hypothetical protein
MENKLRRKKWLDQLMDTFAEWGAIICTREFWGVVAVGATMAAFMATAFVMLTNFDAMRMRSCFNASNMSAYLMLNTVLFFVFGGLLAVGEMFNYFDNRKRGIPHKSIALFWFVIITVALGTVELVMLKVFCLSGN